MTEITGAREATKHAVHSTTVELQELLTMVIEELKATDGKMTQDSRDSESAVYGKLNETHKENTKYMTDN